MPHPQRTALLMFALAFGLTDPRAHATATAPPRTPSPLENFRAPSRGAAAAIEHPNASVPDVDLGSHVAPRALPIPTVSPGQARTFLFDGGHRAWVNQLSSQGLTTASYAHGRVFVGAGFSSRSVYALDALTGAREWEADTPDGGPTAAVVDDQGVYFNTESCTLFAFDPATGRRLWSHYLGDPLMSQPASADGRVFSAYPHDRRYAFSAMSSRDGTFTWTRPLGADVITAPVIVGDAVYATTMDGVVHRFRASDGAVAWESPIDATSAPAVFDTFVFVAQRVQGGLERQVVLGASDGRTIRAGDPIAAPYAAQSPGTRGTIGGWSYEGSRPVYADGRLYYAMGDQLVARDAETGRIVWQRRYTHDVAQRGVTSPAIVGSLIVIGTREGELFGIDIDSGATAWAYRIGEPITFQPTIANGWVYATTANGKVLGLEVADRGVDGWHQWGGNAQHDGLSAHESLPPEPPMPSRGTLETRGDHTEAFPLRRTTIDAHVTGFVARVTVTQEFSNPFDHPVDAEYLFPLPPDAAVDAMDLTAGTRVVHGTIQRREEARATFHAAQAQGRTAALLEQERPNLFRQAVANVQPHEAVRVVLRFAETIPYQDGGYELALPLAAHARSTPGEAATTSTARTDDVVIRVDLDMGTALAAVESPTHTVNVHRPSASRATVTLADASTQPDRDFVLRYRPVVHTAEPTVLADRVGDEGFFTLALHPDPHAPDVELTPRDITFAIDVSSSMHGAPLAAAQTLVARALDRLRAGDRFRIVRFSDTVGALDEAFEPASAETRARAQTFVSHLQAAGSTDMAPAMLAALSGSSDPARLRIVVLVTDGFIGNERDVLATVRQNLGDARVFAFGIGAAVNRYLLDQLAEIGRGHVEVVGLGEDPAAAADRFYAHIDRPYLTDISIDWGDLDVGDVYPRAIPDLFAERPLVVTGRYRHGGTANVTVRARLRGRPWSRTIRVTLPPHGSDHEALPSVWARARIHDLTNAMFLGEVPALRDEVTQLGLAFGLVTDYTSFVAVAEAPPEHAAASAHVVPPLYVASTEQPTPDRDESGPPDRTIMLEPAPRAPYGGCASCAHRRSTAQAGHVVVAGAVAVVAAGRRRKRTRK